MSLDLQLHQSLGGFTLDVAFQAPAHGVTALFGPSGAGKTRVLRAVAGLDRAALGWVRLGDRTWMDESTFVPPEAREVGYVFQESSLFEHLDVAGNIDFGLRRRRRDVAGRRADLVELLGLEPLLKRRPATLSGGERRRVAIARALAPAPSLLLMDEPLAGLDPALRGEVMPYVETLARTLEIPVLLVSHQFDEVARLADHLVLMEAGRVRASGSLAGVLADLDLPLAGAVDAATVLPGSVSSLDERWGLAEVRTGGIVLTLPAEGLVRGQALRLRVAARDVSLVRHPSEGSSILNVFPVTVTGRREQGALVTLELALEDGATLLARITARSAAELELVDGATAYAQVKSVAVLA